MQLTNVVVQGDLGCPISLRELTYRLANALIWRHRNIVQCLLFSNGKINYNGKCSTLTEGRLRLRRYAMWLQKMGYSERLINV